MEKDERTELDCWLQKAGGSIRNMPVFCSSSAARESGDTSTEDTFNENKPSKRGKKRRSITLGGVVEDKDKHRALCLQDAADQKGAELKRIKVAKDQVQFQRAQSARELNR